MNSQSPPAAAGLRISAMPRERIPSAQVQSGYWARVRRWVPPIYKRAVLLVVGDLALVNLMLFVTQVGRGRLELSWPSLWTHAHWFATLSILWLVVGRFLGIYHLPKAYSAVYSLKSTLSAAVIVSFLNFLIPVLTPSLPARRSEAVQFLVLMLGATGLWRFIFARCFAHPVLERRALVIGAGWAGCTLAETLSRFRRARGNSYTGKHYRLIGFIDDDALKQDKVIAGLPVLGTHASLVKLVKDLRPVDLILAVTHRSDLHSEMFQAILKCRELGASVVPMQSLYESVTHQVPLEHTGNNLDVVMPLFPSIGRRLYSVIREGVDILSAIPGLAFLGLMIPLVWAANRLTSPGPLFYRQERVGKSGEVFVLFKFRSMIGDAEAQTGGVWAKENDDRITPIGRFLRKSRLDELPQFWNILKGEMSLIGPRPERPCFVELLEKEIPFYRLRHAIKPGLTGWAQVQYRYGASVDDSFIKLRYDFYYIKNESFFLDLMILLKTVSLVLGFGGR
jgi:exopolysaccharide biosynthesis polyprenyl glycosylphosphotransferase